MPVARRDADGETTALCASTVGRRNGPVVQTDQGFTKVEPDAETYRTRRQAVRPLIKKVENPCQLFFFNACTGILNRNLHIVPQRPMGTLIYA